MYIITKSHLDDFIYAYGCNDLSENEAFEKFIIFSVTSKYVRNQTITKSLIDDVNIGNGGDWGIDGLLIVVNGRIIAKINEINRNREGK